MAKSNAQLKPPAGCEAALYFLDDQLLFQHVDEGALNSKFVATAAARHAFSGEPIDSLWLPHGVSRWGTSSKGTWMVRWHAPAIYTLAIAGKGKPQKLRVPMPALVWFGQKTHYYIWAMKGATFNPANLLYRAPMANVNSIGLICWGQNPHADVSKGGFDGAWRAFWDAPFNDHWDDKKSKAHPANINAQLRALAKAKAKEYPAQDLVEHGGNLDAMIAKLTERGGDGGADYVGFGEDDDE